MIINHILNGAVLRAIEALETHFPSVLHESVPHQNGLATAPTNGLFTTSSPPQSPSQNYFPPPYPNWPATLVTASPSDHACPKHPYSTAPWIVRLNLEIQQFIESFRQLAPSSPSSPSSSISSLTSSMHGSSMTLTHALTALQGLHVEAKKLPPNVRAIYLQEIKDVGALFAYTDPETSILKGFLAQERRIWIAEQVNRAMLRVSPAEPRRFMLITTDDSI